MLFCVFGVTTGCSPLFCVAVAKCIDFEGLSGAHPAGRIAVTARC